MNRHPQLQSLVDKMAKGISGWDGDTSKCRTCNQYVLFEQFRDNLSVKEFGISGMCQKCQDKAFGR